MSRLALGLALGLGAVVVAATEIRTTLLSSPPLNKGGLGGVADSNLAIATPHDGSVMPGTGQEGTRGRWQPLFNGINLDGWEHLGGGCVSVQDGVLVLEHDAVRRPGYFVSRVSARDFEARFQCRIEAGDSGFFFRSRRHPRTPTEIAGPQVQLNADVGQGTGGIFELHGRGWVRRPAAEVSTALLANKDWLDCHLYVTGDHIVVTINEHTTVDFLDDAPDNDFRGQGLLALQIHGGGYCRVLLREMAVRVLD